MRRLTGVVLGICLLAIGSGPVAAQSPSPEPSPPWATAIEAGRIEVPEAGIALTYPDDWNVYTDFLDHTENVVWGQNGSGFASCGVFLIPEAEVEPLEDLLARVDDEWPANPDIERFHAVVVDLPVGQAGRVSYVLPDDPDIRHRYHADYVLTDGARWVQLVCASVLWPPSDRWLSIAETIEWLPAEE